MLGMGVFKQLIKGLYEWFLHSVDVITQHLVAIVLKISVVKHKARAFLLPVVNFLYTIPSLALFALFIPLIECIKAITSHIFSNIL